jgi:hypothetical protein
MVSSAVIHQCGKSSVCVIKLTTNLNRSHSPNSSIISPFLPDKPIGKLIKIERWGAGSYTLFCKAFPEEPACWRRRDR